MTDDYLEQIRAAVQDPGPNPRYHYKVMAKHRRQWPTLWEAIDALLLDKNEPEESTLLIIRQGHTLTDWSTAVSPLCRCRPLACTCRAPLFDHVSTHDLADVTHEHQWRYLRTDEDWWAGDETETYECACGERDRRYIPR